MKKESRLYFSLVDRFEGWALQDELQPGHFRNVCEYRFLFWKWYRITSVTFKGIIENRFVVSLPSKTTNNENKEMA